jgi:deoxyribodipyrimidine photo-lyase
MSIGTTRGTMTQPILHWFRRDLRLEDNTALAAAARESDGYVVPVFILDDAILRGRFASPARTAFLFAALHSLDADLRQRGSRLIVRRGEPLSEILDLAQATNAQAVYWNRDYTPYAIRRDSEAKEALRSSGFAAHSFKDVVRFEMDEIRSQSGNPYTVFTPYRRRWRQELEVQGAPVQAAPRLRPFADWPASQSLPDPADALSAPQPILPVAQEAAAIAQLRRFADEQREAGLDSYAHQRDLPAIAGTSRLSPYLRLGLLSVRQCLAAALADTSSEGAEAWIGELAWRDFYVQVLYHHPHVLRGAFRREYDRIAWENDPDLFTAWQTGRTGFPLVDAAMRQLASEGWMHNRARMVVASFLSKDLLIDWRWGERHFMHLLLDGDPAANNGGWQWAAGTGTDAQPYFRIFNPTNQSKKFDPDGSYIKRYVPELAGVAAKYIHEPERMPAAEQRRAGVEIGRDYPRPIVDHKARREMALERYKAVR